MNGFTSFPWTAFVSGFVIAALALLLMSCGQAPDQSNAAGDEPITTTPPSSR